MLNLTNPFLHPVSMPGQVLFLPFKQNCAIIHSKLDHFVIYFKAGSGSLQFNKD